MGKKSIAVWPFFVLVHSFVPNKHVSGMLVCSFDMFFPKQNHSGVTAFFWACFVQTPKPQRWLFLNMIFLYHSGVTFFWEHVLFKHQNLSGVAAFSWTWFFFEQNHSGVSALYLCMFCSSIFVHTLCISYLFSMSVFWYVSSPYLYPIYTLSILHVGFLVFFFALSIPYLYPIYTPCPFSCMFLLPIYTLSIPYLYSRSIFWYLSSHYLYPIYTLSILHVRFLVFFFALSIPYLYSWSVFLYFSPPYLYSWSVFLYFSSPYLYPIYTLSIPYIYIPFIYLWKTILQESVVKLSGLISNTIQFHVSRLLISYKCPDEDFGKIASILWRKRSVLPSQGSALCLQTVQHSIVFKQSAQNLVKTSWISTKWQNYSHGESETGIQHPWCFNLQYLNSATKKRAHRYMQKNARE